jgi:hypothetical protein
LKKTYLPLSFVCLIFSFLMLPVVKAGSHTTSNNPITAAISPLANTVVNAVEAAGIKVYDSLQLDDLGLSREAFMYAFEGQQNLSRKGELNNADVLTVCDFSQPSTQKRMYIVDVKNFKVLLNTYVAHGKNSGLEFAEKFSNRVESLQSSLGFYVTKQTYLGKHGLSLRLSGLDRGFNDNAERRAVVVHGARYIGESRADAAYMGRSFGCPAVPQAQSTKVINLIKGGTCMFVYHPSQTYLQKSTVLNS